MLDHDDTRQIDLRSGSSPWRMMSDIGEWLGSTILRSTGRARPDAL
ncbi:hypothetical protein [Bosea sp. BIWAKO-01]|nr:hypothetical protein [Bosea sp. BIWAKO-01]GAU81975.1 hypothetical protein BIWAKO_01877 [Bosea sp. BIWAKO-01]